MSEGPVNLNWGPIMKHINESPFEFFQGGGWDFLGTSADDVCCLSSTPFGLDSICCRAISRTFLILSPILRQTLKIWWQTQAVRTKATTAPMGVVVMLVGLISVVVTMKATKVCNIL